MAKRTTKMEDLLGPMVRIHHYEIRLQIFFTGTVADGILEGRRKSLWEICGFTGKICAEKADFHFARAGGIPQ